LGRQGTDDFMREEELEGGDGHGQRESRISVNEYERSEETVRFSISGDFSWVVNSTTVGNAQVVQLVTIGGEA
jgi:hypothetical protein